MTVFTMEIHATEIVKTEHGNTSASFNTWLYGIIKNGFATLNMQELLPYSKELKSVFDTITYEKEGSRYFSSKYNLQQVEANIRKAFCDKCDFKTKEELMPEEASLLNISNFTSEVITERPDAYYPPQQMVENIILDDKGKLKMDANLLSTIEFLESSGNADMADELRKQKSSHPQKNRSFHYLPYRTDSEFEKTFLKEVLSLEDVEKLGLEVYYNGDRGMTAFKIKCYRQTNGKWAYIGLYTPDFLIIKRKEGKIEKVIIIETKGEIYANDPKFKEKRTFMETEFLKQNNSAFGYERFDYLYLEDSLPEKDRIILTHKKICAFFKEVI